MCVSKYEPCVLAVQQGEMHIKLRKLTFPEWQRVWRKQQPCDLCRGSHAEHLTTVPEGRIWGQERPVDWMLGEWELMKMHTLQGFVKIK